jgi:preprotein translocase subunit SecA
MTGTACAAAEELSAVYGLGVVVIPTHAPCRRRDDPDLVFTHAEAKRRAVVAEIARVHATRRPILVGTASVRESEQLAADLEEAGVPVEVMNARNDAAEAEIVARAASLGAVTISTNMAGRGTDIRLGGPDGRERDTVVELGGLYVVGTNRHASRRVDLQLRGRCARQGDPGSTRFFVSLEDPLIVTYGVRDLIPARRLPAAQDAPIDDPVVAREIARAQRIIEGASYDIRHRLLRYSRLVEHQRGSLREWRDAILDGRRPADLLAHASPERWHDVVARFGPERGERLERRLTLLAIDRSWSDYLAHVAEVRDSIHVVNFVGKDPLTEFSREVGTAFARIEQLVESRVVEQFEALSLAGPELDWEQAGLVGPSSTWTYLVNDEPFGASPIRAMLNRPALSFGVAINVFLAVLLAVWGVALRWRQARARGRRADDE